MAGTKSTKPVYLMSLANRDVPIKTSRDLVLKSDGWTSREEALDAAERHVAAIMVAFMRIGIGADFGGRVPTSMIYDAGLELLEYQFRTRILRDDAGPMVFESEPAPRFLSAGPAELRVERGTDAFIAAFKAALSLGVQFNQRERLAADLYNSAFFETSADAKFLTLMMAVESLLDPAPRPTESAAHVEDLLRLTSDAASLSESEKKSLLGTLEWLRRESIGQAGRRLARGRLGQRRYGGKSAPIFFTDCYGLRSNLVHGNLPRPAISEVVGAEAELRRFVADLLSGSICDDCSSSIVDVPKDALNSDSRDFS